MQILNLHIEIIGPFAALFVAEVCHVGHLRCVEQVLEVVRLIYKQTVHAEAFKINVVLVPRHIAELFDIRF